MRQLLSMPTQQLRSVFLAQEDRDYCEDPMENQAGEVLLMKPAQTEQAMEKWGLSCLFGVEEPRNPPTSRPPLYCFKKVTFSLAAALIALMGSHLGTSQRPPPLPFLPPLPPATLCHASLGGTWKHPALHHQHSPAHPSRRTTRTLPPSQPQFQGAFVPLCSAFKWLPYFSLLLSFRNI